MVCRRRGEGETRVSAFKRGREDQRARRWTFLLILCVFRWEVKTVKFFLNSCIQKKLFPAHANTASISFCEVLQKQSVALFLVVSRQSCSLCVFYAAACLHAF